MNEAATAAIDLVVSDVSGQKRVRASAVPTDATVAEMVQELLAKMGLGRNDAEGRPLNYRARLDREGRHLNGDERVGDALRPDDRVTLHPSADAGRGDAGLGKAGCGDAGRGDAGSAGAARAASRDGAAA